MTITQHANIYSFHTSNFNFGEIFFLIFINTAPTWGGNSVLTPRGKDKYDATFTNLSPSHIIFHLRDKDDHWQLRVFGQNVAGRQEQIVKLSKNPVNRLKAIRVPVGSKNSRSTGFIP